MKKQKGFNAYSSNFGGRGWFLVIFSLVTHYLVTASVNTMNVTAGSFSGQHGWSSTVLFSFQTIAGWVAVFTMFISGYLAQKYSPKIVSLVSLIFFGAAFFIWGHVNALWQFLVVLIALQVFGSAASYNGNSVLIANWFPRKRGLAIGWATIGMPLAAATGIILTQSLLAKGGLTLPFYVFGAATIVIVILGFIFLKDYPEQAGCFPDNDRSMTSEQAKAMMMEGIEQSKNSIWTPKKCFKTKEVWMIGISLGLMFLFANGVMGQFIPKALSMGFELNLAIAMMSVAGISACFGSYLCGLVDAKVGPRKAAIYTHIIAAVAMILSIIPTVPTLIIGTVVIGIVMGGSSNYLVSMAVAMWGRYDFPKVYKILAPMSQFVGVGGSALVALLAEAGGGNYTMAYIVMAALGVVGAIILAFVKVDSFTDGEGPQVMEENQPAEA